jgi:recombination protein RecA
MAPKTKNQLDDAIAKIEKDYGKGSIFMLGDPSAEMETERVSSGIFGLDVALGGGFGKGTLVELYGAPGGGKSSLSLKLIASAQAQGGKCVFIDAEHAMNIDFAQSCGVDTDDLVFTQPATGEQAFTTIETFARVPEVSVIVVDSVPALVPKASAAGDYGDAHVGLRARMISQGIEKIQSVYNETKTDAILVFINQIRDKIGAMAFGPTTTTPGGHALRHAYHTRCEVTRIGSVKQGSGSDAQVIGQEVRVHITKNKLYRPYVKTEFDIIYDSGLTDESSVLKLAKKQGVITADKQGWHTNTLTGEKFAHGYLKALNFLAENPEELAALKAEMAA